MPPATTTDIADETVHEDAEYDFWVNHESRRVERATRLLTHWWWDHVYRMRAYHLERLPEHGAFLLVPNHSSYTDPFLLARPMSRRLRFMAKSTLFKYPPLKQFMIGGGAFPVRRGQGDAWAIEVARRMLVDGQPVVVFPEGTRFRSSFDLGPSKRGAARLALQTKVPVVPAAVWGVKRRELHDRPRWRRPKAVVVYGEPMDVSHLENTPENVDRLRDEIWERVHELYAEARQYAESR